MWLNDFHLTMIPAIGVNMVCLLLLFNMAIGSSWQFRVQRSVNRYLIRLFLTIEFATFCDLILNLLEGRHGVLFWIPIYLLQSILYVCSIEAAYLLASVMIVFHKGDSKKRRRHFFGGVILAIVLLVINIRWPFVFSITRENYVVRGWGFYLFMAMCTAYMLVACYHFAMSRKQGGVLRFFPVLCMILPIAFVYLAEAFLKSTAIGWMSVAVALAGIMFSMQKEVIFRDTLTGVYNRFYLEQLQERLKANEIPLFGMLLDLNNFKIINDTHGHSVGDDALIEAAHLMETAVGEVGVVCRYAGDEFVIIVNYSERAEAEQVLEKVREAYEEFNVTHDKPYQLSVAAGIAMFNPKNQTLDEFIHTVDKEMYKDKERFYQAHPEMNRRKSDR